MKKILFILLAAISMIACQNEDSVVNVNDHVKGVFIGSAGKFTQGNASLSIYDPLKKELQNEIYYNTNNVPLGDVLESMKIIKDKLFLAVNNSKKVIVIDINTYKHIATIDGLTSPRYIEVVNDDKIYITDLHGTAITIVNPNTYKVIGTIEIGNGTEQMVKQGKYIYTCSWSKNNKIYKIDTEQDKVIDFIEVTKQPNSIVLDKNGKLWALSDGSYIGSKYGKEIAALTRIDLINFKVEAKFSFVDEKLAPSRLCINGAKDMIYYIRGGYGSVSEDNGIYKMSIDAKELPSKPLIKQDKKIYYGLGIDPKTSDIYVSDAIDYKQNGVIERYSDNGQLVDQFKVGVLPSSFCFNN